MLWRVTPVLICVTLQFCGALYPIAGTVCGEFNFTVCYFGMNSQTFHLLKFLAHIRINDCV